MSLMLKRLREQRKQQPKEKPRYRVRNGKIVVRMYAVIDAPKPAPKPTVDKAAFRARLKEESGVEVPALKPGCRCPKCKGQGVWTNPDTAKTGPCFWCNDPRDNRRINGVKAGKGSLSRRDIEFITARDAGRGVLNYGASA